jgi:surface antigen
MAASHPSSAGNCAAWARNETGVDFMGNAGGWWNEAEGRYARGHSPAEGAILVFKRSRQMPSGHVAVVSAIVGPHEILIDHSNWYRGRVTRRVSAIDTSPEHNWTTVAVIDLGSGKYGRDNPTYGFIYRKTGPREIAPDIVAASYDPYGDNSGLLQFAVDTDDDERVTRHWRSGQHHRYGASTRVTHHSSGTHFKHRRA